MSKTKIWVGLEKEFEEAKKNNARVKTIIYESGISSGHFYKVIAGERKPGEDSIEPLAKALGIEEKDIKNLLSQEVSSNENTVNNTAPKKARQSFSLIKKPLLVIPVLLAILTSIYLLVEFSNRDGGEEISALPTSDKPLIEGDNTAFIDDITLKDGIQVLTNTKYEKIWRIKNSGKITWKNRFLMRVTPFSDRVCHSEKMITIKDTLPGEEVDISAYFTTMQFPGSCIIDWKMTNEFGKVFFPNKRSMYFEVNVTNDGSLIKDKK